MTGGPLRPWPQADSPWLPVLIFLAILLAYVMLGFGLAAAI